MLCNNRFNHLEVCQSFIDDAFMYVGIETWHVFHCSPPPSTVQAFEELANDPEHVQYRRKLTTVFDLLRSND